MKIFILFITGVIAPKSGKEDVCIALETALKIEHGGSYIRGDLCHGLFYTTHEKKRICFHRTETQHNCPAMFPVTVDDARVRLTELVDPSSERSLELSNEILNSDNDETYFRFLAFGDWGLPGSEELLQTASKIRLKYNNGSFLDGIFLLGDNFYPRGIDVAFGVRDPQFDHFSYVLAGGMTCNYYPVMGNHDWLGDADSQLAYSMVDRRWIMPAFFYFKKWEMENKEVTVCTWFIDTDKFSETQIAWLESSIVYEKRTCTWTIISGHYPVYTAGDYAMDETVAIFRGLILPILNNHRIDIYLSGHEHQSQILKNNAFDTTFVVSGATADMRGKVVRGDEYSLWIDSEKVAFLEIAIGQDTIDLKFQKSYGGVDAEPLCFATISRDSIGRNQLSIKESRI